MKTKILFFGIASILLAMMFVGCDNGSGDTEYRDIYPDPVGQYTLMALVGEWKNTATVSTTAYKEVTINANLDVTVKTGKAVGTTDGVYTATHMQSYLQGGAIVQEVTYPTDAGTETGVIKIFFNDAKVLTKVTLDDVGELASGTFTVGIGSVALDSDFKTKEFLGLGTKKVKFADSTGGFVLQTVTIDGGSAQSIRRIYSSTATETIAVTSAGKVFEFDIIGSAALVVKEDGVAINAMYAEVANTLNDTAIGLMHTTPWIKAGEVTNAAAPLVAGTNYLGLKMGSDTVAAITKIFVKAASATFVAADITDEYTLLSPFIIDGLTSTITFMVQKDSKVYNFEITTTTTPTASDIGGAWKAIEIGDAKFTVGETVTVTDATELTAALTNTDAIGIIIAPTGGDLTAAGAVGLAGKTLILGVNDLTYTGSIVNNGTITTTTGDITGTGSSAIISGTNGTIETKGAIAAFSITGNTISFEDGLSTLTINGTQQIGATSYTLGTATMDVKMVSGGFESTIKTGIVTAKAGVNLTGVNKKYDYPVSS